MAVNSDTMKVSYAGDDSTTELPFSWTIYEDSEILVIDEIDATGVQSTLTLNSDYSVTIDASGGGTVVLEAASVTGHTYWLVCNIGNTQEWGGTEGNSFPVKSVETALDKLTGQVIQLQDGVDRAIKIPITEDVDQTLDDVAANRANKAVIFDSAGKVTIGTDDYEDQAANSAASAAAALASQISAAASEAAAAISAAKLKGTSTTSLAIATGSKSFVTQASKQFDVGVWLLITSDADETNYMHGQVTAYAGTALTVNVTNSGGSGTLADWTITVAGTRGSTGAAGTTGTIGVANGGGTVDAITADYTPDFTLADKTMVAFVSAGANTSTTPTFAPDGLTAHTIVKEGGVALVAGDIGAAGYVALIEYNLANTRWELLNPCKPSAVINYFPAGTKLVFFQAAAPTGWTQDTANNDKALRIVSGNGGGTGGTAVLSSANAGATAISEAQMPTHTHAITSSGAHGHIVYGETGINNDHHFMTQGVNDTGDQYTLNSSGAHAHTPANAGSGNTHTHSLALAYVDVIICSKN